MDFPEPEDDPEIEVTEAMLEAARHLLPGDYMPLSKEPDEELKKIYRAMFSARGDG